MNYQLRRYELLNSKLFNMNYALRAYCSKAFPDAACGLAQDDTLDRQEVGGERGKWCHGVAFCEAENDPNESTETSGKRAPSVSSDD